MAIDGPAGSGKSTVAKIVARKMGYAYIDTGAMYRAATLLALRKGINPGDDARMAAELAAAEFSFSGDSESPRIYIDDEDVSQLIRAPELTRMVGPICEMPAVRQFLGNRQRQMGADGGVVLEGRDIGTVIFPDAEIKVFLTADPHARAQRRWQELMDKGIEMKLEEVALDVVRRDERDRSRPVAPLRKAGDSVVIDSTALTIGQVVERIMALITDFMRGR